MAGMSVGKLEAEGVAELPALRRATLLVPQPQEHRV
jgi:hypothetical protein